MFLLRKSYLVLGIGMGTVFKQKFGHLYSLLFASQMTFYFLINKLHFLFSLLKIKNFTRSLTVACFPHYQADSHSLCTE